jgi:hypothetical protein
MSDRHWTNEGFLPDCAASDSAIFRAVGALHNDGHITCPCPDEDGSIVESARC